MRFTFQSGTEAGLQFASPSLRDTGQLLKATADWSNLDLETQAVGLTLGVQKETQPWLEDLASREPARALSLALSTARYSLHFARSGHAARVIEATPATMTACLPTAEFWRELRRSIADSAPLRSEVEAIATELAPKDHRLRAGLAYVFPEGGWWREADRAIALEVGDRETGALMLLALRRHDAGTLRYTTWPPPAYALRGLAQDEVIAAMRWCPPGRRLMGSSHSQDEVLDAFRRVPEPSALLLLSRVQPTPELVRSIRKSAPRARAAQKLVRRVLVDAWERSIERPGALPSLRVRDASELSDAHELARLRAALRLGAAPALNEFARRVTPESLANFAEHLFVQWLLDQTPEAGRWALDATARFPSDDVAKALPEFEMLPKRDVTATLSKMRTRTAFERLATLARSDEYQFEFERLDAEQRLQEAAQSQGLSASELEDRLFPSLTLPPGAVVQVDEELRVTLHRDVVELPMPAKWKAASKQLPAAVHRLERQMVDGGPMSAVHFTEMWAMNPLLLAIAQRVVWGVFDGPSRLSMFVPGKAPPVMGEGHGVRPLHRVELAPEELHAVRRQLTHPQPFAQLTRQFFAREWPALSEVIIDDIEQLDCQLTRFGWVRDPSGRDLWEREGSGWHSRIVLTDQPHSFYLRYRVSEFSLCGSAPWRIVSELQREFLVATQTEVTPAGSLPARSGARDHAGM